MDTATWIARDNALQMHGAFPVTWPRGPQGGSRRARAAVREAERAPARAQAGSGASLRSEEGTVLTMSRMFCDLGCFIGASGVF